MSSSEDDSRKLDLEYSDETKSYNNEYSDEESDEDYSTTSSDDDDRRELLDKILKDYSELKRNTFAQKEENERKIKELTQRLKSTEEELDQRKTQLMQSVDSMKKIIEELTKIKTEKEDLINQIEDERKNHAETIKQLHIVQGQVLNGGGGGPSEIEMTFRVLLEGSKVTEAILVHNVDQEKDDLRLKQQLLEKKIMSLNQDIVLLKQEKDSNKEKINKNNEMKKEIDKLNEKLTKLDDNCMKLKKENENLKKRGSGTSPISFKSESNENSVLKSNCETLLNVLKQTENVNEIKDLINDVDELMKDHFYHRLMFKNIQKKCLQLLDGILVQNGFTTELSLETLYTSEQKYLTFSKKIPKNLENYHLILKEIYTFNSKFKKKDEIKKDEGKEEKLGQSFSRMTISNRSKRRGTDMSGGSLQQHLININKVDKPSPINQITQTKSSITPSISSSSQIPPSSSPLINSNNNSQGDIQIINEWIENVDLDKKKDKVEINKDTMDVISHVWECGGNIWTAKNVEGNKSVVAYCSVSNLLEIEKETLPSRVSCVYVHNSLSFVGCENGQVYIFNTTISNKIDCSCPFNSRINQIGSHKDTIWILSDIGDYYSFEIIQNKIKGKKNIQKLRGLYGYNCACITGKYFYVGTMQGMYYCEYPPTNKSKFVLIKSLPRAEIGTMMCFKNLIYLIIKDNNSIQIMNTQKKTLEIKSIDIDCPISFFPYTNDVWICCRNGCIAAVDNTTLKLTVIQQSFIDGDYTGGCIHYMENQQTAFVAHFYYGHLDELKYIETPYFKHNYVTTKSEGICHECHGKIHKNDGMICNHCQHYFHLECVKTTGQDIICSRDKNKLNKVSLNRSSSLSSPRRSNSVSLKTTSSLGNSQNDNTSDSK